jgi:hypothetical protein
LRNETHRFEFFIPELNAVGFGGDLAIVLKRGIQVL